MPVRVFFDCGGCPASVAGVKLLRPDVVYDYVGAGLDRVTVHYPVIEDCAPEGWMVYDPFSGCTYCPECWDAIVDEV